MTKAHDVPAAPGLDPRQLRYRTSLMRLARDMYGDGDSWTPTQIQRYLAERADGPVPHVNTIRRWVLPREAEEHRRVNAETQRRARRGAPRLNEGELTERQLLDRMLLLRRSGMSYSAIAKVVELYHAVALTDDQVRGKLRRAGAPTSVAKSAAVRRLWAETTTYREAA